MHSKVKRTLAGAAAAAAAMTALPLLAISPAGAVAVNSGTLSVSPLGGTSSDNFTINIASGPAACPGDTATDGYDVQGFMVPAGTDYNTLSFNAIGPSVGRSLVDPGGTPLAYDTTEPVSGNLWHIPATLSFANNSPGDFAPGAWDMGIACTQGSGAGMVKTYWTVPVTITTNTTTGGPAQISWAYGAVPAAPTITTASGGTSTGDQTVHAVFTAPAATPAITSYTATLTGTGATAGTNVSQSGAASPIDFSGVAYGTYDLTVTATNSAGTSPASAPVALTVAPGARPAPTGLAWTAGSTSGSGSLAWTTPTGVAPTGYSVAITGPTASTQTVGAVNSVNLSGLAVGNYSVTVTPLHPAPFVGTPATTTFSVFASQILIQDITVTRPVGALVLTQVCGSYGALDQEDAQLGFPAGLDPKTAVNSAAVGSPNLPSAGIPTGENGTSYGQYPYPTNADGTPNATYPTHCGIDLGNAKFVTSGAGAGQFFAADGRLNQVTVVNTQDADTPWNVVGQVSTFASSSDSFSGSQLGWTPKWTDDTGAFTDSLGLTYDMSTVIGDPVAPNTNAASGLSVNHTLIKSLGFQSTGAASSTGGLGTAIADARLKLLIPVTAQSGTYTATLTISTL
jgi:hypothetical protein